MSKEINHWCVICGNGYHACDTCNEIKKITPWKKLTDTIEHYKIFTVLKDYNNKVINKREAKKMLSGIDLSGRENFKESAKNLLNDIFGVMENNDKEVDNIVTKNIDTIANEAESVNTYDITE